MSNEDVYEPYLRLLAERYPDYTVTHCEFAQQGWDSVTLLINGNAIFRFARRPDVGVRLAREASLLPQLAAALPTPIPRIEFIGEDPPGGLRFVGYRAIPGIALTIGERNETDKSALASQLGAFLSALHRFPVSDAQRVGVLGGSADDWRREYQEISEEVRQYVIPLLTASEQIAVASYWERYLDDTSNFDFAPTLIHRDLSDEHILMNPEAVNLTGVIDWGDASIGDPAIDFAWLWRNFDKAFAERVFEAYEPAQRDLGHETFWRRARFYAEIGPFYEIIFGALEGDAGHMEQGLATLRRTMSDW